MKSNKKIDYRLIIGLVLITIFTFISFYYSKSFWYLYGSSMLFLLSLSIFTVDLHKQYPFFKGLLPAIFSGIILYIIFYIGAFLLKILPFGLDHSVSSAFAQFSPNSNLIWLFLFIGIIPAEEIFWRGFILKRLSYYFPLHFSVLVSSVLASSLMIFSSNLVLVIGMFVASIFWNFLYIRKPSLLRLYISHLVFVVCLLGFFPIY